ncbi:MAG: MBL fold metallo-hydrolase [Ignavibacteriae bacterium]|nr:MAG: MBL fold metallo-hydrolase [Ignavibacteriota bacterium]
MKVETIPVNPFEMNCYIYYDEKSKEGVIIDPAAYLDSEKETISNFITGENIKIKYILNTHGHIDHILGNHWAKETFNTPILMHKDDLPLIEHALEQGQMFGVLFPDPPAPDKFVEESDTIDFGSTSLKIIHAPGHSPGGLCFVDEKEKIIFVGDNVFKESIGRTDLWEGDMDVLLDSINNKIFSYGDDYVLYPGHYDSTTIGEEKKNNPFLQ